MAEIIEQQEEQIQDGPGPKMNVKDFATKIKNKYPQYKDMDDTELANKVIAKYPVYKDQVDFSTTAAAVEKKSPSVSGAVATESSAIPLQSPKVEEEEVFTKIGPDGKKKTSKIIIGESLPYEEPKNLFTLVDEQLKTKRKYDEALGNEQMSSATQLNIELEKINKQLEQQGIKAADINYIKSDLEGIDPETIKKYKIQGLANETELENYGVLTSAYKTDPKRYQYYISELKVIDALDKKSPNASKEFRESAARGKTKGVFDVENLNILSNNYQERLDIIRKNLKEYDISTDEYINAKNEVQKQADLQLMDMSSDQAKAYLQDILSGKDLERNIYTAKDALEGKQSVEQFNLNNNLDDYKITSIQDQIDQDNPIQVAIFNKYLSTIVTDKILGKSTSPTGQVEYQAAQNPQSFEQAAILYSGTTNKNISDQLEVLGGDVMSSQIPPVMKGEMVYNFINNPDIINAASKSQKFNQMYNQVKIGFPVMYPEYAKKIVSQKISQAYEDKKLGNIIYNSPNQETIDEVVESLKNAGKLSSLEYELYKKEIRPDIGVLKGAGLDILRIPFGAFVGEKDIVTPGLIESGITGFNEAMRGTAKSISDIQSFIPNQLLYATGLANREQEKQQELYNVISKDYNRINVDFTGAHKISALTGNLLGSVIPLIAGGELFAGVKGGHYINTLLAFEGHNRERSLLLFPKETGKQALYTTLSTAGDVFLMDLLPTKKIADAFKGTLESDIKTITSNLVDNKITKEEARNQLYGLTKKIIKFGGENAKVTGTLTGFEAWHSFVDKVTGVTPKDVTLEDKIFEIVNNAKTTFLTTPILTMLGMAGKSDPRTDHKILWEMANDPEKYREIINRNALVNKDVASQKDEMLANLDNAVNITNELKDPTFNNLTLEQKQKYLGSAMKRDIFNKKAEQSKDETIKEDYKNKAKQENKKLLDLLNDKDKAEDLKEYQAVKDLGTKMLTIGDIIQNERGDFGRVKDVSEGIVTVEDLKDPSKIMQWNKNEVRTKAEVKDTEILKISEQVTGLIKKEKPQEELKPNQSANEFNEGDIIIDGTQKFEVIGPENENNTRLKNLEDGSTEIYSNKYKGFVLESDETNKQPVEENEEVKIVQDILNRVNNAEYINEKDIINAENVLYDLLDKNPESKYLIEPLIEKIQNYEFTTTTKAVEVTEKVPVEGAYAAKTKIEIKPALESSEGSSATVTLPDGTIESGTLKMKDGNYILEVEGKEPIVIGEKAITDRDLRLPSDIEPVELDRKGNVKSVTLETRDGKKVKIEDPEKALDLGIKLHMQEVGEVPDAVFEKAYQEVTKTVPVEELKPVLEAKKPVAEEKVVTEPKAKPDEAKPTEAKPSPAKERMRKSLSKKLGIEEKPVQTYTKENVKNIDESQYKGDKEKVKIVKSVKNVIKAVSSLVKSTTKADLSVNLHDSPRTYEDAVIKAGGDKQDARTKGFYMADDGSIHINMSRATSETIQHEAFHPILDYLEKKNPELIDDFHNQLSKIKGGQEIIDRAKEIYKADSEVTQKKEAITDFVAKVADGSFKIDQSNFQAVKQYVINMLTKMGLYAGEKIDNITDLVKLAQNISAKFQAGKKIRFEEGKAKKEFKSKYVGSEIQKAQFQLGDELAKEDKDYKKAAKIIRENNSKIKSKNPEAIVSDVQIDKDGKPKIIVTEGEDGAREIEVLYKKEPYQLENGASKYISKNKEKAIDILSDEIVKDYKDNINRPEISAAIGWYANMRKWFQKNFGANIETFGQLLAATSARTEVVDNFKQAVEALRNLSKGKYNDLLADYDKFVKGIESLTDKQLYDKWKEKNPTKRDSEFDASDFRRKLINQYENVPLRSNGKKFNANSKKVLQALYGNWLTQTEGPKTKNFAGNLTGRSFEATIDVWAARYLRRKIFENKVSKWRILPQSEGGVQFGVLKSGEMSGDYPFAEKVMKKAAEKLNVNPDDLQAFLWYLEKDVWDKNNWTNITGKKKASFEDAAKSIDSERYQLGVTTFKDMPSFDKEKFEEERKSLEDEIGKIPGIIASRVTYSEGEFVSETDIFIEPTFDVEFTVEKGTDISKIIEKVDEIQNKYNQDATLVSKSVDEYHPNARPIIEIGLASPVEKSLVIQDIKNLLVENNVRGFTISKDRQGRILGFRAQFIPEFESGTTKEQGLSRFLKAYEEVKNKYENDKNISYIASGFVDTRVKFKADEGKQEKLDGGAGLEEQGVQRFLPETETGKGGSISFEEKGEKYEAGRGGAGYGLAGESEIPGEGIKPPSYSKEGEISPEEQGKLKNWVEEQRQAGESDSDISDVLKEYGYGEEQVKSLLSEEPAVTGIKKAVVSEERQKRALADIEVEAKRTYGDALDTAKNKIASGEIIPSLLAAEIAKKPRTLSAEESAALMTDRMRITKELNRLNDLQESANSRGDKETADIIQSQIDVLLEDLNVNDQAARKSGYEAGLSLGIRRMMIAQDYTFANQMQRLKNAAGGKEVAKKYEIRLKELTKQLEEANKKLDQAEKTNALRATQNEINKVKEVKKTPEERKDQVKSIKDKILDKWKKAVMAIKEKAEGKPKFAKEEEVVSEEKAAQLKTISGDVKAMVKAYAESGVTNLKDIVSNIEKELSDIPDINKTDIENIIIGKYAAEKIKTELTSDQIKARADYEKVKTQIDDLRNEVAMKERTAAQKATDYLHGWHRFAILSGIPSLGKIGTAALTRGVVTRTENVIGAMLSKIPGISYIAKGAPREGRMSAKAEAKAFSTWFDKMTRDDIRQVMKTGKSELDYLYGDKARTEQRVPEWMEVFGKIHAAIKLLPKRAEFFRSLELRSEDAIKSGLDVRDPLVQEALATAAYNDASRAIFMQDNPVTDAYRSAVNNLEKSSPILASGLKFMFPIIKVPTNYVAEESSYMIGGLKAMYALRKGVKEMTPEQKDYFMRALKKQSIGLAFIFLGYCNPNVFGGYYSGKRKEDDLEAGDIELFGKKVPHWMTHTPLLEMLQVGATIRRAQDAKIKQGEKPDKLEGVGTVFKGQLGQVPFYSGAQRAIRAFDSKNTDNFGKWIFGTVESITTPQLVQNIADWTDTKEGQKVKRTPEGFIEQLKSGVPGLRQTIKEDINTYTNKEYKGMETLTNKGINIPEIDKKSAYKVNTESGIMSDEEYGKFVPLVKKYAMEEYNKVLKDKYQVFDRATGKVEYKIGVDLDKKDLQNKIDEIHREAIEKAKEELNLASKSRRTVKRLP